MTHRAPALLAAVLLAACGATGTALQASPTPPPTPTRTPARATPTAVPTPTRAATPSPAPSATPMTSARGNIVVSQPLAGARITSPVTVSGVARVFEAAFQWRIVDAGGRVLGQGNAMASAGAPAFGSYNISAVFTAPAADTSGFVEVFDRSARDGSIDEIVRVPVTFGSR